MINWISKIIMVLLPELGLSIAGNPNYNKNYSTHNPQPAKNAEVCW